MPLSSIKIAIGTCLENPEKSQEIYSFAAGVSVAASRVASVPKVGSQFVSTGVSEIGLARSFLANFPRFLKIPGPLSLIGFIFMPSPDEHTYEELYGEPFNDKALEEKTPLRFDPNSEENRRQFLKETVRLYKLNPMQSRNLFIQHGLNPEADGMELPSRETVPQASTDGEGVSSSSVAIIDPLPDKTKSQKKEKSERSEAPRTLPVPPFSPDPAANQFIKPTKTFVEKGFDSESGILTFPNGRQLSLKLPEPLFETPQLRVAVTNMEFYSFRFYYPRTGYWLRIINHYRDSRLEISAAGLHFKYEGGGVGGLEGIEYALLQFLDRVGKELKGVSANFFETIDRMQRLIPQALKGEIEAEESFILREALVYGKDFVRWLVANSLHQKLSSSTDGYELVRIFIFYLIYSNQTLSDFHKIDLSLLNIDYYKNLGIGKGFQNLGYGSQNHGIFRAQLKGSNDEIVVKWLPAEATEYVFREVRNYALISEWDLGPHFYGYTLSPDGNMVGVVMDEIHDGLNTKNLQYFSQFRQEAISRFHGTTIQDMQEIRHFFDLFSIHTGDLDLLVTPDGHLHIIDPAEFVFFKDKPLYPQNPDDIDFDNPEALLLSWILDGMIDPEEIPVVEQGRILEYVIRRYGHDKGIPLIRELNLRGLNKNK